MSESVPPVGLPMASTAGAVCASCAQADDRRLTRLGLTVPAASTVVALAGNPNTGKSTVFNQLTGLRQRVGNWPGTTVARSEGGFGYGGRQFRLVDLPGTYSLFGQGRDEAITRDYLLFGAPDVTVVVLDASRLERHLNLALQVLEVCDRVVIAVNLMDEAGRAGIGVDVRQLARRLGAPVVPMAARERQGLPELLQTIGRRLEEAPARPRPVPLPAAVERAVRELTADLLRERPGLPNARWVALKLIEGDTAMIGAVADGTIGSLEAERDPGLRLRSA